MTEVMSIVSSIATAKGEVDEEFHKSFMDVIYTECRALLGAEQFIIELERQQYDLAIVDQYNQCGYV